MDDKQIIEYVRSEHLRGVNYEVIVNALVSSGSSKSAINQAFLKAPSVDFLMKETAKIFNLYKKPLLIISSIPVLFNLVLLGFDKLFLLIINQTTAPLYWTIIIGLINLFIQLWFGSALIYFVTLQDNKVNLKQIILERLSNLRGFIWVSTSITVSTIIGFVLLIIPGIVFSNWFIFSPYIFFEEKIGGINSLKQSHYYVKGYLLAVIWRTIIICISVSAIYLFIGTIITSAGLKILSLPLSIIITILLKPIPIVFFYILYQRLKETKAIYSILEKTRTI